MQAADNDEEDVALIKDFSKWRTCTKQQLQKIQSNQKCKNFGRDLLWLLISLATCLMQSRITLYIKYLTGRQVKLPVSKVTKVVVYQVLQLPYPGANFLAKWKLGLTL